MAWLVNPSDEEDFDDEEAVLFNAEDSLDFEDNPRGRRKRSKRRKKAGRPKKSKRGGKRRKHVIRMIEVPRKRRRTVKRKHRKAGRPKKAVHHRRKKRSSRKSAAALLRKIQAMGPKSSAVAGTYESNPKRKRRHHKKTSKKYAENYWAGQPRRHKKAAKKGWRRRRKASRYQSNPKHRKQSRRLLHARIWRANPMSLGGIKGKIFGPHWYNLPTMEQLKFQPWHAVGFGVLGLVDSSLIAMGVDYVFTKYGAKVKLPEPAKDITRIVVGRIIGGSAISYGIAKFGKNTMWAKFHQTGVYAGVILDVVGTSIKYIMRAVKGKKVKLAGEIPFQPQMNAQRFAASCFGLGSIMGAVEEQKLIASIQADGIVVATNGEGKVALANANTGEIIVSGPAESMTPIVQAVQGVAIAYDGDVEGGVDGAVNPYARGYGAQHPVTDSGGMGEDISSES